MTFMRFIVAGIALCLAYAGLYAGSAYLASQRITDEMVQAFEQNDRAVVEGRVDWHKLQSFLKSDLKRRTQAAASGFSMGPPIGRIDEIVDYYVQPDNIDLLFALRPDKFPNAPVRDFVHRTTLDEPFGFRLRLGYPRAPQESDRFVAPTMSEQMTHVDLIFRLDGWTWRIQQMDMPLFLVPKRTYEKPAHEHFLPRAGE